MKRLVILCSVFLISIGWFNHTMAGMMTTSEPEVYFDFNGDSIKDASAGPYITGTTFSADMWISGIGEAEGGLLSWGVQIDFDPAQIQVNSLTPGSNWNIGSVLGIDNSSGTASIIYGKVSPLSPEFGTIFLGSVEFSCLAEGVSNVSLNDLYPGNLNFDAFVASDGTVFDEIITFSGTSVTQTPVPEPTTMLLFGTGLAGLAAVGRRRKK